MFGECIVILFESIYLAILKFYEYIGLGCVVLLLIGLLLRHLKHFRSTKIVIQGLLNIEQDCSNCKQFIICQFCHHCQTSANHYEIIQMCLNFEQIKLVKRGMVLLLFKIMSSVILELYTVLRIEKTINFYQIYQAAIIAVLFVNSILFLLLMYFGWRVYVEIRNKSIIKTSPEGFREMEQQSCAIQQLEKSRQKEEQKNPTPDQVELEDKGSVFISINENMSPAMLKLVFEQVNQEIQFKSQSRELQVWENT
ncbi:unnamed protein product [Paramecium sonneborni]|uniref:Uncharacterized protein n=1 Tax=Paramecium sonneborni TaxID=65129 RepID=A0A8S1QZU6_9CILI|nr:unnamed protein product [Paramecium sonneborni]